MNIFGFLERFGLYVGRIRTLETRLRRNLQQEFRSSLDQLVGKELNELRENLRQKEAEVRRLTISVSQLDKYKEAKDVIANLRIELENSMELVRDDVVNASRPYLRIAPERVVETVGLMAKAKKKVLYFAAFFKTFYSIDDILASSKQWEVPPGLQLLEGISSGCKGKLNLETARAFSLYVEKELRDVAQPDKLSAYNVLVSTARQGKFDQAVALYDKDAVHQDYVRNLTETERELIRIKTESFGGSWSAMLETAEQPGRSTRILSKKVDIKLTAPLIRKLMDYESQHSVVLTYSEKAF